MCNQMNQKAQEYQIDRNHRHNTWITVVTMRSDQSRFMGQLKSVVSGIIHAKRTSNSKEIKLVETATSILDTF